MLLDAIEQREKRDHKQRELNLAILASGMHSDPLSLFEEFTVVETDDSAEIDDDEVGVSYVFSDDPSHYDPDFIEREMQEMRDMIDQAAQGTDTFGPATYGEWL